MVHLYNISFNSGILVSVKSTVWNGSASCENNYQCYISMYLTTVLSATHGNILDLYMGTPGHRKGVLGGMNEIYK